MKNMPNVIKKSWFCEDAVKKEEALKDLQLCCWVILLFLVVNPDTPQDFVQEVHELHSDTWQSTLKYSKWSKTYEIVNVNNS